MIIKSYMAEVQLSAPTFPPISCWRLHRSDMELKRSYQLQILRAHGVYLSMSEILVSDEYKEAA